MKDILTSLEKWREANAEIALATVVETWGSSPRPVGSKLAITAESIAGSVSAGCVEGAVIESSKAVMQTRSPRLLTFGVADDKAWEVGLTCGGMIRVFVEPFSAWESVFSQLKPILVAGEAAAVVSVLDADSIYTHKKLLVMGDGGTSGNLNIPHQMDQVKAFALSCIDGERGSVLEIENGSMLFVEVYPRIPRLIVIGAVHIADPLVTIANALGFETIVIDHRRMFATRDRFSHAHKLIHAWPQKVLPELPLDRSSYIVILTHDPRVDEPALEIALQSGARYIGALGSKRSAQKRIERLRELGLSAEHIGRLHGPIGLPIGGIAPGEIAISIIAEIVKVRNA